LALGIGCTTAAFSLFEALLLRPLPALHAPETLVAVGGVHPKDGPDQLHWLSFADYLDYAGSQDVVSGLAAGADCDLTLLGSGPAERIAGLAVSANYFSVLGLKPARGRLLSPGEETAPVAVLGYGLWQRRFGGDPAVIGSGVTLNGKPFTIAGVAPEGFLGTDLRSRREVWLPLGVYSQVATGPFASLTGKHDRKQEWLSVFGRLAPGVSLAKAQSALGVVAKRLAASHPEDARRGVRVLPLSDLAFGSGSRRLLVGFSARLLAVAALVLAVAAINVAGLLLARSLTRRQETAVRLSLGASPRRLVRQLFCEGLVLALLAAALGAALATLALPLLAQLNLPVPIAAREFRLSWRMLGFALLVALLSSLVFALVPALQAVRASLLEALRGTPQRVRGLGLRELLAGAQVALALLILIASGLMVRTLANLRAVDPGFDPEHVLVLSVDLAPAGYKGQQVATFYRDLLERLRRLPGIEEASMASALPVIGNDLTVDLSVDRLEEQPAAAGAARSRRGMSWWAVAIFRR
jgi:predicted permease